MILTEPTRNALARADRALVWLACDLGQASPRGVDVPLHDDARRQLIGHRPAPRRTVPTGVELHTDGMSLDELEALLLTLAADVHEKRTGNRAGGLIVEDGDLNKLGGTIGAQVRVMGDGAWLAGIRQALKALHRERGLR